MKTILTTIFAIALMVFAFNTSPAMADSRLPSWFAEIIGKSQVTEVQVADWDDDEKADQYGGEWFKVDENGNVEVAWDTEPTQNMHCWDTVGKNGRIKVCVPDDSWNSQSDESKIAFDTTSDDDDWSEYIENQPWFNEDENDGRELAYGASCTTDWKTGKQVCCTAYSGGGFFCYYPNATASEGIEVAWQPSIKSRSRGNNDSVQERARVNQPFGAVTNDEVKIVSGQRVRCWSYPGGGRACVPYNEAETETDIAAMPDKVKEEDEHIRFLQYFAGFLDHCKRTGNCMMYEDDGTAHLEFAGKYHDSGSLILDRDRRDWNEYVKKGFAFACKVRSDGSVQCPGDAWNQDMENLGQFACYGRDAVYGCYNEDETSDEGTQVAGMTMEEKIKQDEDDWNQWILKQMFASHKQHLVVSGTQYARPYPSPGSGYCDPYESGTYCPSWNQDEREQREFASDEGQEESVQQAGSRAGVVLDGDDLGDAIRRANPENDRVLESGDY